MKSLTKEFIRITKRARNGIITHHKEQSHREFLGIKHREVDFEEVLIQEDEEPNIGFKKVKKVGE